MGRRAAHGEDAQRRPSVASGEARATARAPVQDDADGHRLAPWPAHTVVRCGEHGIEPQVRLVRRGRSANVRTSNRHSLARTWSTQARGGRTCAPVAAGAVPRRRAHLRSLPTMVAGTSSARCTATSASTGSTPSPPRWRASDELRAPADGAARSASPRSSPTGRRATSSTTSRWPTARLTSAPGRAARGRAHGAGRGQTAVAVATGAAQRPGGVHQGPHPADRRPAEADRQRSRSSAPSTACSPPSATQHRSTGEWTVPELPEVQAHAERLTERVRRRRAAAVRAAHLHRAEDRRAAAGRGLRPSALDVGRRGKYLLLRFEPVTFVVHLMQGGRLLVDAKQSAKPRNGQARFVFEPTDAGAAAHRGRAPSGAPACGACPTGDVLDRPPLDRARPGGARRRRRRAGRALRRAQHARPRVPARPALHRRPRADAGQRGLPPGQALAVRDDRQARRRRARRRWSTRIHEARRRGLGLRAHPPRHELVGGPARAGCTTASARPARCAATRSARCSYSGYTVAYCPTCQTGGKVLADNTTASSSSSRASPGPGDQPSTSLRCSDADPPPRRAGRLRARRARAPATRGGRSTSPRRSSTRLPAASTRSAACSASPARSRASRSACRPSGMGGPSAAIYYSELIQLGAQRLVRVGTVGGLQPDGEDGRHGRGHRRDGRRPDGRHRSPAASRTRRPRRGASSSRRSRWPRAGRTVHVGPVVTSGAVLRPRDGQIAPLARARPPGVEMEAAVLYTLAAIRTASRR